MRLAFTRPRAISPVRTMLGRGARAGVLAVGLAGGLTGGHVSAQSSLPGAPAAARPEIVDDFDSPAAKARAKAIKELKAVEREMRKIRLKHLGGIKVVSTRQEGIALLLAYRDPKYYATLIDVCAGEADDVRGALLESFAATASDALRPASKDQRTDAGTGSDAAPPAAGAAGRGRSTDGVSVEPALGALAWMAVNDRSPEMRARGSDRLLELLGKSGFRGASSPTVREIVKRAVQSGNAGVSIAGAQLAQNLGLYEAIAWMIPAQFSGGTGAGGSGSTGDRAWIAVGKQHAFISDLTPVVGNNAVAFDPTLSVITEGVLLRVQDAAVFTVVTPINTILIGMSTEATGRSTKELGSDSKAWEHWYASEFLPLADRRYTELTAAARTPAAAPMPPAR